MKHKLPRKTSCSQTITQTIQFSIGLIIFCALFLPTSTLAKLKSEKLEISTSFANKKITPRETLELKLSRTLFTAEGKIAVFIGATDLTALFIQTGERLSYTPKFAPLPTGKNKLTVYLVESSGEWKTLAEFLLDVKTEKNARTKLPRVETDDAPKVEFTPALTLNLKGQNQIISFPLESAPTRNPFTDLVGQGNFALKITSSGWSLSNQFDFAGSSFRQEALRFSELGNRAPQIDLSSYLVTLERGRFNAKLGHVSFGSNRHLINGFSSRGLSVTIPFGKQNEISLAAMNGTSIVGFDNFVGATRREHSVFSTTLAREFIRQRPGGLRLEVTALRGSLLPLSNFNQSEINDAEKSFGGAIRLLFKDKSERLRFEGGFTRSRFINPPDAQLEQKFEIAPARAATRNARFIEASFDFLQGLKLWQEKKLKVTGTYRHEELEPLFRSIVAATQADRRQHQFEVSATFGEINFAYGNLRDRDNLRELSSILQTINRCHNAVFGIALDSFFNLAKPLKWLPRIGYTYEHIHQFGASFPVNGEFRDASQIPDQDSFAQSFNAEWQFSEKFRFGYRYNRAFQDNKQPGREIADFLSAVNAVTVGTTVFKDLDLNFDFGRERQKNFEQPRIDGTFRVGSQIVWRMAFPKNAVLNANFSTSLAGDTVNANDARSAEFDVQWTYKFQFGSKKNKKLAAQFFVRYANRYGETRDQALLINNFNKTQAFNAGLTFNLF